MAFFRGISFPFRRGAVSLPAVATDGELVRQSLLLIVTTPKGSRVMRPYLGSNVLKAVFENNGSALEEYIRTDITKSIAEQERRVLVQRVDVVADEEYVNIDVVYLLLATGDSQRVHFEVAR